MTRSERLTFSPFHTQKQRRELELLGQMTSSDITGGTGTTTTVGSAPEVHSAGTLTSTTTVVPISIPTLAWGHLTLTLEQDHLGTAASPTITQSGLASGTSAATRTGSQVVRS